MKTILPLAISLAAFSAIAQSDKAPTTNPVPPPVPNDIFAPIPPPPATAAVPARPAKAAKRADMKVPTAPGVMAQPVPPPAPEKAAGATSRKDRVLLEGDTFLPRSAKTGRTLIVQTSDPDPSAMANAEEDLSVMALILLKATGVSRSDDKRMAMGIEVFGSSSGARNIYLEGYGALFLLGVRFPLIAPPDSTEETKVKEV